MKSEYWLSSEILPSLIHSASGNQQDWAFHLLTKGTTHICLLNLESQLAKLLSV